MKFALILAVVLAASACASRQDAYFGKISPTVGDVVRR
jgi:hypothetical protein